MLFHRKDEPVPAEWYEITKGKDENPFFTMTFHQDCESMFIDGVRNLRTVSGIGLLVNADNCNNMNINWLGTGINFICNNSGMIDQSELTFTHPYDNYQSYKIQ